MADPPITQDVRDSHGGQLWGPDRNDGPRFVWAHRFRGFPSTYTAWCKEANCDHGNFYPHKPFLVVSLMDEIIISPE